MSGVHKMYGTVYNVCVCGHFLYMRMKCEAFIGMFCVWFQPTCWRQTCHAIECRGQRAENCTKNCNAKDHTMRLNAVCLILIHVSTYASVSRVCPSFSLKTRHPLLVLMRIGKSNIARADNRVWLINLFRPTMRSGRSTVLLCDYHWRLLIRLPEPEQTVCIRQLLGIDYIYFSHYFYVFSLCLDA